MVQTTRPRGPGSGGRRAAITARLGPAFAACVAIALAVVAVVPARAASSVVLPTSAEAWYQTPATSAAQQSGQKPPPPPAAPPPANPYGAGTMHVGIRGGVEDARTYLRLDSGTLESDDVLTAAILVLPVDPGHGTTNPQAAQLDVCLSADPGQPVEGSFAAPPAVDCSVSTRATYEASPKPRFVADVLPFGADALRDGGLAVLPASAARSTQATWHVSFFARQAAPSTLDAMHAELEVDGDDSIIDEGEGFGAPSAGVTSGGFDDLDIESFAFDERPSFADVPIAGLTPSESEGESGALLGVGGRRVATPVVVAFPQDDGRFAYPVVLVFPVVAVALIGVLGSSLTRKPRITRIERES